MSGEQDDFWGNSADWPELPETARIPRPTTGARVSRWWNQIVGGGVEAPRVHGRSAVIADVVVDDLDSFDAPDDAIHDRPDHTQRAAAVVTPVPIDDQWDDDWTVEEAPAPKPAIDPLLARIGGLAIVTTLLVPLALGLGSANDAETSAETAPSAVVAALPTDAPSTSSAPIDPAAAATTPATAPTESASVAGNPPDTTESTPAQATPTTTPPARADQAVGQLTTSAIAEEAAERAQSCAIEYEVVVGDFWIRIADGAGVPVEQLLEANDATTDTPLYPGGTICLPLGAAIPSPPTTAPASTEPPAPATTAKPVATTAPATTAAPVVTYPTIGASEAQQIIRDVWPDDLEERALAIADRESNFVVTARNSCCYGLFQIHWTAHRNWLAGLGVTSPEQLFDATTNAYVAYALYQQAGGFGPWT